MIFIHCSLYSGVNLKSFFSRWHLAFSSVALTRRQLTSSTVIRAIMCPHCYMEEKVQEQEHFIHLRRIRQIYEFKDLCTLLFSIVV